MLNDYGKSLFRPLLSVPNIVLLIFVIFVSILALKKIDISSSEWASWVQAIGSIVAIIVAFMIGNIQHQRSIVQRREDLRIKEQEVKDLLLRLSQDIDIHLGFLMSALDGTFASYGVTGRDRYHLEGYDLRWIHQRAALEAVDVKNLNGIQLLFLTDIKTACTFAIKVCERLTSWDILGKEEQVMSAQILFHKSRTDNAYKLLGMTNPSNCK